MKTSKQQFEKHQTRIKYLLIEWNENKTNTKIALKHILRVKGTVNAL